MNQLVIAEKPELTVIGQRRAFIHALSPDANNHEVIGSLWCEFMENVSIVPNRRNSAYYGIIFSEPEVEQSHPHELHYLAGVCVNSAEVIPDGMVAYTVPATTFAVFTHRGRFEKFVETVQHIYRDWLPNSDYEHSDIADVELYDERFRPDRDDSESEYWVSVKPNS